MLKFRESLVSAHHNYLVNQMLSPGFVMGILIQRMNSIFLLTRYRPGKRAEDLLSVYDAQGNFVWKQKPKRLLWNPSVVFCQSFLAVIVGLFSLRGALVIVQTESFANGFLTRIQGNVRSGGNSNRALL